MAVEARGSMVDEAGSSHEVATAVAIVEASGVHPVALHPTKVVGCGGSSSPFPMKTPRRRHIQGGTRNGWVHDRIPSLHTAWPARSDRCSCFCLRRIGLKEGKGQVSPSHYST